MATLRLPGITGGKDEETGLIDVKVHHFVSDYSEVLTVGDATFMGVPLVSRAWGNWEPDADTAGYQVDLSYKGKDEDDEFQETWSFDNSFDERPFATHPNIKAIIDRYGGTIEADGSVTWPIDLPEERREELSIGLSNAEERASRSNPMFGRGSRRVFFSVATRKYFSTSISAAFQDRGKVFDRLPGNGPNIRFVNGENWLKTVPQPESYGNGWLITEEYWLSDYGGWKKGLDDFTDL